MGGCSVLAMSVFPHCGDAQQWSRGHHCVVAFVHERQVVAAATPLIMKTPLCIVAEHGGAGEGREVEELRWRLKGKRVRRREGEDEEDERGTGKEKKLEMRDAGAEKGKRWERKEKDG